MQEFQYTSVDWVARSFAAELCFAYNGKMSKRWFFFSVSAFLFIQFTIFSFLVHKNLFKQTDFNTTVVLQNHISRRFDGIFSFLSDFGKFEIMTIVLIAIFVISRKYRAGLLAFALYGGFHFIELFGKYFVNHPPPAQFMIRTQQVFNFPQFTVRSEFSYPSGHAGRALFISMIIAIFIWNSKKLSLRFKILLTVLLFSYDFAMLLSRVILGEHWLTDVIGGSILGAAFGIFTGILLVDANGVVGKHLKTEKKSFFPKYKLELKRVE